MQRWPEPHGYWSGASWVGKIHPRQGVSSDIERNQDRVRFAWLRTDIIRSSCTGSNLLSLRAGDWSNPPFVTLRITGCTATLRLP